VGDEISELELLVVGGYEFDSIVGTSGFVSVDPKIKESSDGGGPSGDSGAIGAAGGAGMGKATCMGTFTAAPGGVKLVDFPVAAFAVPDSQTRSFSKISSIC
jgi:hypothetical protein